MEAKDSLVKIIRALQEIETPVNKQTLIDFLLGKDTREITQNGLDEADSYGSGDNHDEDYWTSIIDTACEQGFLKLKRVKSGVLVPTAAGKKFAKKPSSFLIDEEREITVIPAERGLDELVFSALNVKAPSVSTASPRTQQQMKLIHAIDCKVALDDFAESESLGFDEVLDEAEKLVHQGRALDITYFTDEVMGDDCVQELVSYFENAETDDIDEAMKEYGDVYNEMEIRLARIVYRVSKMGKKK